MLISETNTKVLISGAGPSGLMMAAQLLRYGIQPLIVDDKQGPTTQSKALAVQARSLEIYRQMGVINEVLANGKQAQGVVINQGGKEEISLSLKHIGEGKTLFPYVLMYQQSKNERLLLDYLTVNCCPVYWNTKLTALQQNAASVQVQLKNDEGEYSIKCDYVIGADGAHSTVRKQLQIAFNGDTYAHFFYLLDTKLNNPPLTDDYVNLFLGENYFNAFFPMTEEDSYRIIGNLPESYGDMENITIDEVLPYLDNVIHSHIQILENNWFATYKLHHRMAANFRQQRCFLIGDAAHIHSPVGGQGMNTGLQDAYNLAWKLASVIKDQIKADILESYPNERMPVARNLLNSTDKIFNMIMSTNIFISIFKKYALTRLLNMAWKNEHIRSGFFERISQISIAYRDSSINLHLSKAKKIKAGDRLPYLKVYDEKKETETDLHEWCSKPGFTLLILGKFDEMYLFKIAKWITQSYPGMLNFFYLPPSGKNIDVFNALETLPTGQKAILIRPDMYIGYMNDVVDINMLDNYLKNVIGFV